MKMGLIFTFSTLNPDLFFSKFCWVRPRTEHCYETDRSAYETEGRNPLIDGPVKKQSQHFVAKRYLHSVAIRHVRKTSAFS